MAVSQRRSTGVNQLTATNDDQPVAISRRQSTNGDQPMTINRRQPTNGDQPAMIAPAIESCRGGGLGVFLFMGNALERSFLFLGIVQERSDKPGSTLAFVFFGCRVSKMTELTRFRGRIGLNESGRSVLRFRDQAFCKCARMSHRWQRVSSVIFDIHNVFFDAKPPLMWMCRPVRHRGMRGKSSASWCLSAERRVCDQGNVNGGLTLET